MNSWKKISIGIVVTLFFLVSIFGCKLEFDGDPIPKGDELETTAIATVITVTGNDLEIETDTGVIFDVTKPSSETVAVDDIVQVTITFEGDQDTNEWNLIDVTFDEIL